MTAGEDDAVAASSHGGARRSRRDRLPEAVPVRRLDTAPVTPLILPSYGSAPRRGGASGIAALPFAAPVTPVRTEDAANGSSFRAGQLVAAGTAAAVIAAVATAFTPGGGGGTLLGSGFTFAEAQQGPSGHPRGGRRGRTRRRGGRAARR